MDTIPLIATIDIGTTSTRAILFKKDGTEFAKHQIEYRTSANSSILDKSSPVFSDEGIAITETEHVEFEKSAYLITTNPDGTPVVSAENPITLVFPQPGWVEVNPVNILSNSLICLASCLTKLGSVNKKNINNELPLYEISALGIANMRETTLVWSKKTGLPLYNGIVWNDTRTSSIINDIIQTNSPEFLETIRQKCGVPPATYFSASKIKWLCENVESVRDLYNNPTDDDCLMFGTVDTWLVYNLSREKNFVTDITNASRTGLMDLDSREYDEELFKFWGIEKSRICFPKISSSSEFFGTFRIPNFSKFQNNTRLTDIAFADLKRYLKGVPITGILGDQSSSMVGQLVLKKGSAKCTYGTGAFLLYNIGNKKIISRHGNLTTFAFWFPHLKGYQSEPCYALEGSIAVAGSLVSYLRDNLKFIEKASDVGPLATAVPDSCGVVFVPAFSGLYSPYWINTRGNIFGLTQFTTSSHIARAGIEGVCFQVKAILKAMGEDFLSEDLEKLSLDDSTEKPDPQTDSEQSIMAYQEREDKLPLKNLSVDGGMSNSDEVMQIQANILGNGVTINKSISSEATAFGAAVAAGFGFEDEEDRIWANFDDLIESISSSFSAKDRLNSYHCTEEFFSRNAKWKNWEKAVERSKGWFD